MQLKKYPKERQLLRTLIGQILIADEKSASFTCNESYHYIAAITNWHTAASNSFANGNSFPQLYAPAADAAKRAFCATGVKLLLCRRVPVILRPVAERAIGVFLFRLKITPYLILAKVGQFDFLPLCLALPDHAPFGLVVYIVAARIQISFVVYKLDTFEVHYKIAAFGRTVPLNEKAAETNKG
jgi:hypothetical protein